MRERSRVKIRVCVTESGGYVGKSKNERPKQVCLRGSSRTWSPTRSKRDWSVVMLVELSSIQSKSSITSFLSRGCVVRVVCVVLGVLFDCRQSLSVSCLNVVGWWLIEGYTTSKQSPKGEGCRSGRRTRKRNERYRLFPQCAFRDCQSSNTILTTVPTK